LTERKHIKRQVPSKAGCGDIAMPEENQEDLSCLAHGYEGVGEYYDLFADNSDIPFYIQMATATGSPILELAAGTGRVSIALAHEGFDVCALEKSSSMLDVARKRLQKIPRVISRRVTLVVGDMEHFNLNQSYALIIIPNSFGHALTRNAQISTLNSIRRHLQDDGLFVLDLYVGETQYAHAKFEDPPQKLENGRTVERQGEICSDMEHHLMRINLKYTVRNTAGSVLDVVEVTSGAALIFRDEIERLLTQTGLEVIEEYGNFDRSTFDDDSSRRILILKKSEVKR
jgi:ubiquinone/menaquinone biosynthesis C-methylase UbiE